MLELGDAARARHAPVGRVGHRQRHPLRVADGPPAPRLLETAGRGRRVGGQVGPGADVPAGAGQHDVGHGITGARPAGGGSRPAVGLIGITTLAVTSDGVLVEMAGRGGRLPTTTSLGSWFRNVG